MSESRRIGVFFEEKTKEPFLRGGVIDEKALEYGSMEEGNDKLI